MKIYCGFSTTSFPLSKIIRWLTKSQISHTWLLAIPTNAPPFVIEAGFEGIQETLWESWQIGKESIEIRESPVDLVPAYAAVKEWLGQPYDFKGLIGEGYVILGNFFHQVWHNPLHSPHEMFCSALVSSVLKLAGCPGAENLVPADSTPMQCYDLVKGQKNVTKDMFSIKTFIFQRK